MHPHCTVVSIWPFRHHVTASEVLLINYLYTQYFVYIDMGFVDRSSAIHSIPYCVASEALYVRICFPEPGSGVVNVKYTHIDLIAHTPYISIVLQLRSNNSAVEIKKEAGHLDPARDTIYRIHVRCCAITKKENDCLQTGQWSWYLYHCNSPSRSRG